MAADGQETNSQYRKQIYTVGKHVHALKAVANAILWI